jgi:signal transduction histidine kinase
MVARVPVDWWVVLGLGVVVGGWVGWLDGLVAGIPGVWPWGWVLLAAEVVVLRWRRRWPVWVLGGTGLAGLLYWLGGYPLGPHLLPQAVALYTVAAVGRRRVAVGVAVAGLLAVGVAYLTPRPPMPALLFSTTAWLAVVVGAGELSRSRRERLAQLRAYAAELARGREQEARRRVAEERLRLSRELHDVVSHHIGVIHVQSGAALLRMDRHPDLAGTALTAIHRASTTAMTELRGTLGLLRTPDSDDDTGDTPPAPAPTLDRLPEVVDRARSAGLSVTLTDAASAGVGGGQAVGPPLPAVVEHAAYRIVQESLTNAARHAGPTEVRIDLVREPDHLVVTITDDGSPATPATGPVGVTRPGGVAATGTGLGAGLGVQGMAERAAALGGELVAGPADGGGFVVRAVLPVAPAVTSGSPAGLVGAGEPAGPVGPGELA